jgi:ABC-type multidrug transport system ATPase subunit
LLDKKIQRLDLLEFGKRIGMCPQFNSLSDDLTVRENLQFIAGIKGLSKADMRSNIDLVVRTMDLQEFANVPVKQLSGGNKRKLSCAMTLMLCP